MKRKKKKVARKVRKVKVLTKVMDLFSAKGGTQVGAMLEAIGQTTAGKDLINKMNGSGEHLL